MNISLNDPAQITPGTDHKIKTSRFLKFFKKITPPFIKRKAPAVPAIPEPKQRTFAIFMDYRNLELHLKKGSRERLENFSWLLDPILQEGKIVFAFVFIPTHYIALAPIMQLSHIHHFFPVVCPRQVAGAVTKDHDSVDNKLESLARDIIQHSDITDIVIISGDADFSGLATFAHWQQKKVRVISALRALSGRFIEMHRTGTVDTVKLIE
ncbi:MAG: NYN domain-containing protein [bacterium]|nr:NYN domain-containing protein [bacterium]